MTSTRRKLISPGFGGVAGATPEVLKVNLPPLPRFEREIAFWGNLEALLTSWMVSLTIGVGSKSWPPVDASHKHYSW
jgi:hypothetical protein